MQIYRELSRAMISKGITQRMIADAINCHYNTVNAKLTGKSDFTLEEARKIHQAYFEDRSFAELFTATDTNKTA